MAEMTDSSKILAEMNDRSREVFRRVVEGYLANGEPVGSRTLTRTMTEKVSAATIRNVMQDLEFLGLLGSPHISAGRVPTQQGLRMFVDGLLERGNLSEDERKGIESQIAAAGGSLNQALDEATTMLSGLSRCAGLVIAPKKDEQLKHIEFVALGPGRALVVMVDQSGNVENRVIDVPVGMPASSLVEASNYLSARLVGRSIAEASEDVRGELEGHRAELDQLTSRIVEAGLATWTQGPKDAAGGALIVRGQSHLLEDVEALEDLERVRQLFSLLERKEALLKLLDLTQGAEGVQIFIGAENELFSHTGCSMVIAPYSNSQKQIVGAIGVIGPTRIDYARIIPMVDYTAKVIGRLIG